jgi:FkbM family methyltransferase
MSNLLTTYAQNREDLIIYVLLNKVKNGFYVDVGANDPTIDSVTKFFYDRGWHGVNIEPINEVYERISKNRKRDINLHVAISNEEGSLELREYGKGKHGWSTLSSDIKQEHGEEGEYRDYKVKVKTLSSILDEYKVKEIDFMKVDVEGFEYEVLSSNDWKRFKPKVIVVEDTFPEKWTPLIEPYYQEVHHDGLNRYFVRNDLTDVCTMKDYKNVLLNGAEIMSASQESLNERFKLAEKWLYETQEALKIQRDSYQALKTKWNLINEDPSNFFGGKVLYAALIKRLKKRFKLG